MFLWYIQCQERKNIFYCTTEGPTVAVPIRNHAYVFISTSQLRVLMHTYFFFFPLIRNVPNSMKAHTIALDSPNFLGEASLKKIALTETDWTAEVWPYDGLFAVRYRTGNEGAHLTAVVTEALPTPIIPAFSIRVKESATGLTAVRWCGPCGRCCWICNSQNQKFKLHRHGNCSQPQIHLNINYRDRNNVADADVKFWEISILLQHYTTS